MTEEVEQTELKQCQLCYQMLSKDQFYKRNDRNKKICKMTFNKKTKT